MFGIKKWITNLIDNRVLNMKNVVDRLDRELQTVRQREGNLQKKLSDFYDKQVADVYDTRQKYDNTLLRTQTVESDVLEVKIKIDLLDSKFKVYESFLDTHTAQISPLATSDTATAQNPLKGAYMGLIEQGNNIFQGIFYLWERIEMVGGLYKVEAEDSEGVTFYFDYYEEKNTLNYGRMGVGFSKNDFVKNLLEAEQLITQVCKNENLTIKEEHILNQSVSI